jgi:predicted acetyltransferase
MGQIHEFHRYDLDKHKDSIHRLYKEVGWLEEGEENASDIFLSGGNGWVAEVENEAEAHAHSMPATLRYLDQDLNASCITSVATSRIARKHKLATYLTAHAVAQDAMQGALVSILGIFEQGFYDQLGYGTGSYEQIVAFDPATLKIKNPVRIPKRLSKDDGEMVHQSRLNRMRGHGSVNILPKEFTLSMLEEKKGFGLGFFDGPEGTLSHHIWFWTKNIERGPYSVWWTSYQSYDQLLELLSILKSFEEQVFMIRIHEPQGLQLQDLLKQPLKERYISTKSNFERGIRSVAYWQLRICDLEGCLHHTHLKNTDLSFNLILEDPISKYLPEEVEWRGIAGKYVLQLGPDSSCHIGEETTLSTLQASVGAFSRLWLGVRPASGLAITDNLSGPPELLSQLDDAFRLPEPKPDWDF